MRMYSCPKSQDNTGIRNASPAVRNPCRRDRSFSPISTVKNILKGVESHVRVMSYLENVSTSSSYTALRLRHPVDHVANLREDTPTRTTGAERDASSSWSRPFTVSRVHRDTTTQVFYDDVIAPCISNCCSGQCYLFLVSGPQESGRSQTMYGSPHRREKGLVELAALDFLARISACEKTAFQFQQQQESVMNKVNLNGYQKNSATENKENVSTTFSPQDSNIGADYYSGGLVVTFSAFTTRGSNMVDTITGEPVQIHEFPPPLGSVPLPYMRLLEPLLGVDPANSNSKEHEAGEAAARVVVIPERKHIETSCIIQFQVYAPVDGSGRRSMSTLTFVDMAAFRTPLCSEVAHVVETVRRVAGLSDEGDPNFKSHKLTTLLEPALVGHVTLVSISTICGRPDLYESTCAALQFANDITRIHQVLMLLHSQTPRWLFETGVNLERLRQQRDRMMRAHYARGVSDFYHTVSNWLLNNVGNVGDALEEILVETGVIRKQILAEVEAQTKELDSRVQHEGTASKQEMDAARDAYNTTSERFGEVQRLDEAITRLEQDISHIDLQNGHRIGEIRIEISSLETKTNNLRLEVQRMEKEKNLYHDKWGELCSVLDKYADDFSCDMKIYSSTLLLEKIGQKRKRLEEDLELASQVAHQHTDHLRVDRQRRSRLSRMMVMQQRVESLIEAVHSASVGSPYSRLASRN
ncbi:unnamed protein product [Phytomonas sp. EM1]|nr:unnamed protein product [Phytomonas sp. EM1]|eukprot:CCW61110.1 unnamed protein product [Phytomonas sp. isolate EM1]